LLGEKTEEETRDALAALTPDSVERAARALSAYLIPTPLQHSQALSELAGCEVYIKLELIQPIRAFKVRGALNKIIRLPPETRVKGVITASAGNHGQGVAYGAHVFGVPATVYVPTHANPLKVEAMKRLGATVVHAGDTYNDAYFAALHASPAGAAFVHAFDDPDVIAGQGTLAVELVRELPEFDTVMVPVGGGGLISGIALYLKARRPHVRVIGVEPRGADAVKRSLDEGEMVTLDHLDTIADGLATTQPGRLTFELTRRYVDDILLVDDAELLRAIRMYFEREHLLAEPAGAAALAGLLYRYRPAPRERVIVLLSGANVTDEVMMRALAQD
jgi:threonine dehydratase